MVLSEVMTLIIAIVIVGGIGFGMYVGMERDQMVDRAQASLAAIRTRIDSAGGELIVCDNSMVPADTLENAFLPLTIKPIPIDEEDPAAGFGAALYISSDKEDDGSDTFDTASRLFEEIKETDETALRELEKQDEYIEYFVLASTTAACRDMEQPAEAPETEIASDSERASSASSIEPDRSRINARRGTDFDVTTPGSHGLRRPLSDVQVVAGATGLPPIRDPRCVHSGTRD